MADTMVHRGGAEDERALWAVQRVEGRLRKRSRQATAQTDDYSEADRTQRDHRFEPYCVIYLTKGPVYSRTRVLFP